MTRKQGFAAVLAEVALAPVILATSPTESFATSGPTFVCSQLSSPTLLSNNGLVVVEGDRVTLSPNGGGASYSPPGSGSIPVTGTIVIDVTAALAGNWNVMNSLATCVIGGAASASGDSATNNFIETRIDTLASTDIDLFDRLGGNGGDGNPVDVAGTGTSASGTLAFNSSLGDLQSSLEVQPAGVNLAEHSGAGRPNAFDVWIKGRYSWMRNGSQRADLGLLYLGTDYRISPDVVLGVLAQFDWTDERDRNAGSNADGFGWMAGPYLVARLHEHLIFDARGAYGTSDNDVRTTFGARSDFDTTRWLVRAQLTGDFSIDRFDLNPYVKVLYIEEDRESYTDSFGNRIRSRTVSLGRLQFGPRISTSFDGGNGIIITPHATVSGIYDFDRAGRFTATGQSSSTDRARAKVEGGIGVTAPGGVKVDATGYYDGIGISRFDNYGGSLKITVPLN